MSASHTPSPLLNDALHNLTETLNRGRAGGAAVEVQVRTDGEADLLEPRARDVPHYLSGRKQAGVAVESDHVGVGEGGVGL